MAALLANVIVLMVLVLPIGLANYYYYLAFDSARRWLPQQFRDGGAHLAINRFVWSGAIPDAAQRNFLRAHIFACISSMNVTLFFLAQFATRNGLLVPLILFAGLTVFIIIRTTRVWLRYRRQRHANASPPATAP